MRLRYLLLLFTATACYPDLPDQSYQVPVGEEVTFEVFANPARPFYWDWANRSNVRLLALKSRVYYNPFNKTTIGSGGREVWTFVAQSVGEDTLHLVLRPYLGDTTHVIQKQYQISVKVIP